MNRPLDIRRADFGVAFPFALCTFAVLAAYAPVRAASLADPSPVPSALPSVGASQLPVASPSADASPSPSPLVNATAASPALASPAATVAPSPSPSPSGTLPVLSTTSLDIDAGTLGFGGGIGETFAGGVVDVRVLTGFFNTSFNGTEDSVNYTGNVRLSNILLMTDLHPGGGSFHIGAGLSVGSTAATASGVAQPGGGFVINNTPYSSAQLSGLNAGIKLGTAPVVLLGFGGGHAHTGLGVNFDLGAIFENPMSYVNPVYGPAPAGINDPNTPQGQQFAQNLAVFQTDLKSAASYLHTYPVLNLGLAYHF